MKKTLRFLLVLTMVIGLCSLAAYADDGCTTYPNITLEDSVDFTVVGAVDFDEVMKVVGLDALWVKHDFISTEKQYLTWTTDNPYVAKFVSGFTTVTSLTGVDQVTVKCMGQGTATITVTYNPPDDPPVTVTSYVVVEGSAVTSSVSNIDIEVDGIASDDFTLFGTTVPLFDLNEVFGMGFNDDDVLKKTPTAMHALLYALEIHYSTETPLTPIGMFDWNWVAANVTVYYEGSFVSEIGSDVNNFTNGWQFELNAITVGHASSITPLSQYDYIDWAYKALPW